MKNMGIKMSNSEAGKGSKPRKYNVKRYDANYDIIFNKVRKEAYIRTNHLKEEKNEKKSTSKN
jgi:hypothetical protein